MSARLLKYTSEISLITEVCCNCGVAFAMPQDMQERRKNFFCPVGHQQHYTEEHETEKLKKQVENLTKREQWAKEEARKANEAASKAEKSLQTLRKRAKAGVCPCCKRTVSQMAKHMAEKHPDFKP
jgi:ElaB/YqjD/DUF883 family membrane-anchored ribosome-binding protein